MVTHEPMRWKKKRHWVLALLILALAVALYWREEEPAPPPPASVDAGLLDAGVDQ